VSISGRRPLPAPRRHLRAGHRRRPRRRLARVASRPDLPGHERVHRSIPPGSRGPARCTCERRINRPRNPTLQRDGAKPSERLARHHPVRCPAPATDRALRLSAPTDRSSEVKPDVTSEAAQTRRVRFAVAGTSESCSHPFTERRRHPNAYLSISSMAVRLPVETVICRSEERR
jgi:hypothetical protein